LSLVFISPTPTWIIMAKFAEEFYFFLEI
jgi:hypothetical protein